MVFTIGGLPVNVDISTLLLAFLVWLSGFFYLKEVYPSASKSRYQLFSILAAVGIFGSVILHEVGHAVVAHSLGLTVTGGGMNFLAAYVNIAVTERYTPTAAILVSIAGPLVNLLIGAVLLFFVRILDESVFENSLQFISYMSVKLGLLNLLPVMFLDGGHAAGALVQAITGSEDIAYYFVQIATILLLVYYFFGRKREKVGFLDRFFRAQ